LNTTKCAPELFHVTPLECNAEQYEVKYDFNIVSQTIYQMY